MADPIDDRNQIPVNGAGKIDGENRIIADPDTDGDTDGDTGNDPAVRTGPGRHPKNCPCPKCAEKRKAEIDAGKGEPQILVAGETDDKKYRQPAKKATPAEIGQKWAMFSRLAALALKMPELAIDDAEAKELGKNVADVLAYYDYRPSGPAMAWTALLSSLGMIYGPKILRVYNRVKTEKGAT